MHHLEAFKDLDLLELERVIGDAQLPFAVPAAAVNVPALVEDQSVAGAPGDRGNVLGLELVAQSDLLGLQLLLGLVAQAQLAVAIGALKIGAFLAD